MDDRDLLTIENDLRSINRLIKVSDIEPRLKDLDGYLMMIKKEEPESESLLNQELFNSIDVKIAFRVIYCVCFSLTGELRVDFRLISNHEYEDGKPPYEPIYDIDAIEHPFMKWLCNYWQENKIDSTNCRDCSKIKTVDNCWRLRMYHKLRMAYLYYKIIDVKKKALEKIPSSQSVSAVSSVSLCNNETSETNETIFPKDWNLFFDSEKSFLMFKKIGLEKGSADLARLAAIFKNKGMIHDFCQMKQIRNFIIDLGFEVSGQSSFNTAFSLDDKMKIQILENEIQSYESKHSV